MHSDSKIITWIGAVLLGLFAAITFISERFTLASPEKERPILVVFALFTVAFGVYLFAVRRAVRSSVSVTRIFEFAIAFRVIMLFSTPILEIDVYRYIWDGNAAAVGVNPYEFSPKQVLEAQDTAPANLRRLSELSKSSPALQAILETVHFGQLPSPYPPVSQAVFATSALLTPNDASIRTHLLVMRTFIVLFDLGTLWLVVLLLRRLEMPTGWAIAYGWCPLVLKEFANSGHLDSITVFLTVAAAYALVRGGRLAVVASAALLAAATAAKFYPLVLLPVFAVAWVRFNADKPRWARGLAGVASYVAIGSVLLFPMFTDTSPPEQYVSGEQNSDGFHAFVRYWEMNDFLFMLAIENLKPDELVTASHPGWFVVVPESVRSSVVAKGVSTYGLPPGEVPFLTARLLTVWIFGCVVLWTCWRLWRQTSANNFLRACFTSVAWVWLLAPTQNPWYWTWSLAFIPFAFRREWLWIAGLTMIYYLRFWFEYHYTDKQVFGTAYQGTDFFDYVVTCIEFGPWFIVFWAGSLWRLRRKPLSRSLVSESVA